MYPDWVVPTPIMQYVKERYFDKAKRFIGKMKYTNKEYYFRTLMHDVNQGIPGTTKFHIMRGVRGDTLKLADDADERGNEKYEKILRDLLSDDDFYIRRGAEWTLKWLEDRHRSMLAFGAAMIHNRVTVIRIVDEKLLMRDKPCKR